MNTYNIFNKNEPATILYYVVAEDENQLRKLAEESKINLEGLMIEIERVDVRNELGKPYMPSFKDAIIK